MPKPRINHGDFSGLKEKGVSPRTIEVLKSAVSLGAKVAGRNDLLGLGITPEEAELVYANASLTTSPSPKATTVSITVSPKGLIGYVVGIHRQVTGSSQPEETLLPLLESSSVEYIYDDATTHGPSLTVFIKGPNGEFVQSTLSGQKATHHLVKKEDIGAEPISVIPVSPIGNAKQQPPDTEPLLPAARVKGRLISGSAKVNTEKRQLVIEAATRDNPQEDDFFPLCYAATEFDGYFFTSQITYPTSNDFKNLTAARARVAFASPVTVPIRLELLSNGKGRLPDRLILFVNTDDASHDADAATETCDFGFHDKKALDEFSYYSVIRTTEPVIEAYEISDTDEIELDEVLDDVEDDVRAALSGLVVKRGTLASFISRYSTIRKENVGLLLQQARSDALRHKVFPTSQRPKGRVHLGTHNAVDWDEKPTIYQAVSIAHGHLLGFKQEWFHGGYSLGDLIYSLPLAPGQKKQIVVFDWDRKDSASNVQQLDYQESLYNSLSRDRDVNEVAKAMLKESISASSEASSWGIGGGLGVGAIVPADVPVGALLGVSGGYGSGSSSAHQTASRTATASSQQHVADKTVQAANGIRSQRSTVVQTVSQGERFQVSAESVANYNHCHAMTIQYFEVLRHFEVRTRLANVRECLFIPLRLSAFTAKKALRWRNILARCLLRRDLVAGFDALQRIEAERESDTQNYYDRIGLPENRFAQEHIEYLEGELYIEFQISRPRNDKANEFVDKNWSLWEPFIGTGREFYDRYLRAETARDEAFAKHAGPRIAQAALALLKFDAVKNGAETSTRKLDLDATLMSPFKNGARLNVSLRLNGPLGAVRREDIDFVRIYLANASSDAEALAALARDQAIRLVIHDGSMRYRTRNLHEHLFQSSAIRNDLTFDGDDVRVFCPLSHKALQQPRVADVDVGNRLLAHLNESVEYYHQCIWLRMDEQRRFMLLDGILAPGRANGRSVASVVENKLIGIVGNCLVMPVAPGFKLDPVLDESVDLYEHYYEDPLDPIHVALPTKGVFAEAVLGKCNSCEKKDETRFWRWDEAPIPDSPTAINPITAPTPQAAQPNLGVKDFASPIINLQNAPSVPDPQGVGALTSLLSNPNVFRDLSGLTENQKNSISALQSSLKSSEVMAQGAAQLAQSASAMKLIQDARKAGAISNDKAQQLAERAAEDAVPEQRLQNALKAIESTGNLTSAQRSSLTEKALNSYLGSGGTSSDGTQDLTKILDRVNKSKSGEMSVKRSDGTELTTKFEGAANVSDGIENRLGKGGITPIRQPNDMACWAAVATMMVNWKEGRQNKIEDVVGRAGAQFLERFRHEEGLFYSEKEKFLEALGLQGEPPASYPAEEYHRLLTTYGPLWVTVDDDDTADFSAHALLVTGISNDLNTVEAIDPSSGAKKPWRFDQFAAAFSAVVIDGHVMPPTQIVHFKDPVGAIEGGAGKDKGKDAHRKLLANIVLSEADEGQLTDLAWIYFNIYSSASGDPEIDLRQKSSAYKRLSVWFRTWAVMLGNQTYANDDPPPGDGSKGMATIGDFVARNEYMRTAGRRRVKKALEAVNATFDDPTLKNPHPGWKYHGSWADFTNTTGGEDYYIHVMARKYWLLMKEDPSLPQLVKILPGSFRTVIFDGDGIQDYFRKHPTVDWKHAPTDNLP